MKNSAIDPQKLDNELFTDDDDDFETSIDDIGGLDDFSDFDEEDDF
ncbi:hypothetical protein ADIARSV_2898 [Arcticibacter svalbardensis MN12-7]|uniref:Uncharacterized protein n=1 Tax=Arcticibacter svalbardensis MN12-7 TaxID=1150600 RepID=R9GQS6_9SPHI|nr:hypothetical protein [Arcticibacter svalbardensis]EOR93905.1 hypothetical protein ADIARSV_2898 [Arcticibacter svalbardensis MN12-7]